MRSETEIRQKLDYYEGILAGVEAGRVVDNPAVFLLVSQHFPREAMEMLLSSYQTNELIQKLPPEDQPWVRQWFNSLAGFARAGAGNQDKHPQVGPGEGNGRWRGDRWGWNLATILRSQAWLKTNHLALVV